MDDLHPGGGEEEDVRKAEDELKDEEGEDGFGGGGLSRAEGAGDEPSDKGGSDDGAQGMDAAEAEQPGGVGVEILRKGGAEAGGGEEGIAQSGERAADAHDKGGDEAGDGDGKNLALGAEILPALAGVQHARGEGEGGEQQEGVAEVDGEHDDSAQGLVAGDVAKLDEERAEEGLVQEQEGRDAEEDAGSGTFGGGTDGPGGKQNHGQDGAGDHLAVDELNDGVESGREGDDLAVAERPVIAAAGAGAGGAYECSPKDDEDVVGDDDAGEVDRAAWVAEYAGTDRKSRGCHDSILGFVLAAFLVGELFGALRGTFYGLDERDTQTAFFKLQDSVNGTAGGGGDLIFEQGRVVAGLKHHAGGAEGGLRGEEGGDITRETDVDASLCEGLNDDVEEGRAGAAETRDSVHVFFIDYDGAADCREDALCERHLVRGAVQASAESGDAGGDHGRGVGHGSDDAEGEFCGGFNRRRRDGGGEGEDELGRRERGADDGEQSRDLRGFDAKQDDICPGGGGEVVCGDVEAKLGGKSDGAVGMLDGGDDLVRSEQVVLEEALKQDAAHLAGAEDCYAEAGELDGR